MRRTLNLVWWLLLLGALEASSLALDRSHHLGWGLSGLLLVKTGYVAFAALILFRFLSFRSQKSFESMADSYNRITARNWDQANAFGDNWRKTLFYMSLLVFASSDFITALAWSQVSFKASILLDLAVWVMALRWIVRAHWLKALGRKERLKEELDNARSRRHDEAGPKAEAPEGQAQAWPFFALFFLALALTLALTATRWKRAPSVFRVDQLKACLDKNLQSGIDQFYRQGEMQSELAKEGCLAVHGDEITVDMDFEDGEVLIKVLEKPASDYFGNGLPGDQGLILHANGRYRELEYR